MDGFRRSVNQTFERMAKDAALRDAAKSEKIREAQKAFREDGTLPDWPEFANERNDVAAKKGEALARSFNVEITDKSHGAQMTAAMEEELKLFNSTIDYAEWKSNLLIDSKVVTLDDKNKEIEVPFAPAADGYRLNISAVRQSKEGTISVHVPRPGGGHWELQCAEPTKGANKRLQIFVTITPKLLSPDLGVERKPGLATTDGGGDRVVLVLGSGDWKVEGVRTKPLVPGKRVRYVDPVDARALDAKLLPKGSSWHGTITRDSDAPQERDGSVVERTGDKVVFKHGAPGSGEYKFKFTLMNGRLSPIECDNSQAGSRDQKVLGVTGSGECDEGRITFEVEVSFSPGSGSNGVYELKPKHVFKCDMKIVK